MVSDSSLNSASEQAALFPYKITNFKKTGSSLIVAVNKSKRKGANR